MTCFICQKHAGLVAPPPGGYIYEDAHWRVCHAPVTLGALGTLFVEAQRHFLDFAEMTLDEAASYGLLLRKLYGVLKPLIGAERIYHVVLLEGHPHFHAWLVPRLANQTERGMALLTVNQTCGEADVQQLAQALRELLVTARSA